MLVSIPKHVFDSLDDSRLLMVCIEHIFHQVDQRMAEVIIDVFDTLTEGQRSLLMFQTVVWHTEQQGIYEFYCRMGYILGRTSFWGSLNEYLMPLGGEQLRDLLIQMRSVYDNMLMIAHQNGRQLPYYFNENMKDYPDLQHQLNELDEKMARVFPDIRASIAKNIRSNPEQYVVWQN